MKKILLIALTTLFTMACSKDDESSIFGVASLDDGNPISGATVKLYNEDTEFILDTQTGAEGDFRFTNLESGNYYIGATVTVNDSLWDSGNLPQLVFVSGEIAKEVALTLTKKNQE